MDAWRWAAARAVGTSHLAAGTPCQDAVAACGIDGPAGPVLAAAVSDGAGSARFGREGARAVVRSVLREAERWFAAADRLPDVNEAMEWLDAVRADVASLAAAREAEPRDFAATLVAAFAGPEATLILHVGDGAAVIDGPDGWEVASWPAGGEYAGTTYFVTDDPVPRLRITVLERPTAAIALFSDGIETLVLDPAERRPADRWFELMFAMLRGSDEAGRDRKLCRMLRWYLRRPELDERTDDDKSLLLAIRR